MPARNNNYTGGGSGGSRGPCLPSPYFAGIKKKTESERNNLLHTVYFHIFEPSDTSEFGFHVLQKNL